MTKSANVRRLWAHRPIDRVQKLKVDDTPRPSWWLGLDRDAFAQAARTRFAQEPEPRKADHGTERGR